MVFHYAITNQRRIASDKRTYTNSSFFNVAVPSKLALAFVKSASAFGSRINSPHKFGMFGLSSLVCKVNGIPLYDLHLDKSYRMLCKFIISSLGQDLKLFENFIQQEMFTKICGIIVLELSGIQDMTIVRTDILHLDCTFVESLEENVGLISLNQFETT